MGKRKPKSKHVRSDGSIPNPTRRLSALARAVLDGPDGLMETVRRISGTLASVHRDLYILRTRVKELEQAAAALTERGPR